MRTEENVAISYGKAWRGKRVAEDIVRGTFEENFAKLPSYCYMIEKSNPGTLTRIHTDSENKFKYFFMALGAAIRGFQMLRNVIVIDATFMLNKYEGIVLIASATDSENHCYPLAWGVGDSEDTACWTWFLECLREVIPDRENLVIVSDRGSSIANAVKVIYPLAEHGSCYWHIKKNILSKWRGNTDLANLFYQACYSYTENEFQKYFNLLKEKNERCADWLENDVKFEKWSRVHQRVNRYETMTSFTVEVLNKVIKKAKDYPICAMVGFLIDKMGSWFYKRREAALQYPGPLTKKREETLRKRYESSGMWAKFRLGYGKWKVESTEWNGIVDLENKSCSCGVFQIERMPCDHAIAAAMDFRPNDTGKYIYELTSDYYKCDFMIHAYIEVIYPVPSEDQWINIPHDVNMREVLPPYVKRSVGRPRTSRFKSAIEKVKKTYKCSICKGIGHNAKTCPRRFENSEQS